MASAQSTAIISDSNTSQGMSSHKIKLSVNQSDTAIIDPLSALGVRCDQTRTLYIPWAETKGIARPLSLSKSFNSLLDTKEDSDNAEVSTTSLKRSISWPSGRLGSSSIESDPESPNSPNSSKSSLYMIEAVKDDWLDVYDDLDDDDLMQQDVIHDTSAVWYQKVVDEIQSNLRIWHEDSPEYAEFAHEFLPSLSEELGKHVICSPCRIPERFREAYGNLWYDSVGKRYFSNAYNSDTYASKALDLPYNHGKWEADSECVVCYKVNGGLSRLCCDQTICESCLKEYFSYMIENEGRTQISCPACEKFCQRAEISFHLSPSTLEKYCRFLINANNDHNRKLCPQCNSITERPNRPLTKHEKKYGLVIICEICSLKWCYSCQAPAHTVSCKKFRAGDTLFHQWTKAEMDDGKPNYRNARRCPNCRVYIQRSEGCDHMQCSLCHRRFCYACGCTLRSMHLIGGHSNKLSVLGCKRLLHPNHPHLRRFIRGSILGSAVVASPAIFVLACGAGIVAGAVVGSMFIYKRVKRRIERRKRARMRFDIDHCEYQMPDYLDDAYSVSMEDSDAGLDIHIPEIVEAGDFVLPEPMLIERPTRRKSSNDYITNL